MNKIIPILENMKNKTYKPPQHLACISCKNATVIVSGESCLFYCSKLFKNVYQSMQQQQAIHDCSAFEDSEAEAEED